MTNPTSGTKSPWSTSVQYIMSPEAVRERCHQLYALAQKQNLMHFQLHEDKIDACAQYVTDEIKRNYPLLDVPYHSRFRHFTVKGHDRWFDLQKSWATLPPLEQGRRAFELVMVSVLLDAGAGPQWRYHDAVTGTPISRSEGLAIASLDLFLSGRLSNTAKDPHRVDHTALMKLSAAELHQSFQVTPQNPLLGVDGRVTLLNQLGAVVERQTSFFSLRGVTRLGHLFDHLVAQASGMKLPARTVLVTVLKALGGIWPGRIQLDGINLGDCWRHPLIEADDDSKGLIPFHKLSQWLSYSLMEPLESFGISITNMDAMTGLAEYRNGGLFIDSGVLSLKRSEDLGQAHEGSSPLVVEWRGLTVALLDVVATKIRAHLSKKEQSFPLVKILQGGTWTAGRRIALEKRPQGTPPLQIISDGTLF